MGHWQSIKANIIGAGTWQIGLAAHLHVANLQLRSMIGLAGTLSPSRSRRQARPFIESLCDVYAKLHIGQCELCRAARWLFVRLVGSASATALRMCKSLSPTADATPL